MKYVPIEIVEMVEPSETTESHSQIADLAFSEPGVLAQDLPTDALPTVASSEAAKGYHLLLQVRLGDQPVLFVVDTGASKTVVDLRLAQAHVRFEELPPTVRSMSVHAEIEIQFGYLYDLQIDDFRVTDFPVGVLSLDGVNQMYTQVLGREIAGLLGSDFLMRYGAQIDYGTAQLGLRTDIPPQN